MSRVSSVPVHRGRIEGPGHPTTGVLRQPELLLDVGNVE